ncbi:SAM-dependent methyltransferase [Mycobacterium asiaticum]|uniref:SAM-dependent methyltransferase n=1 Tax=Mycobacterium asiaticum TaxID=1790 RepID=A0A1A3PD96_MYCAS|nr:class I SAM-dependent methyltransferase [Mycobacterium asiaticum]OBK31670.1 SAM-dependent methyltransferase [Mycobacterium asiaticum]
MTEQDRRRWDERYSRLGPPRLDAIAAPSFLRAHADIVPAAGHALEVACGQGLAAVWLARRGLQVWGIDVSEVAVEQARDLARRSGVDERCQFDVVDLDDGLPAGPAVDMLLCHKFRDRRLDQALVERLAPGGLLAIATHSEVDATPGPFRAMRGELSAVFGDLEVMAAGEGDGRAWLLGRA